MKITFKKINEWNLKINNDLLELLVICDKDFEPTLSSSRLYNNQKATLKDKLQEYINEKKETHTYILIFDNEKLIGFMNFYYFVEEEMKKELKKKNLISEQVIRVDTAVLLPEYRNKNLGQELYAFFEEEIGKQKTIIVRSASKTNLLQNHLFQKQGYQMFYEKKHSRNSNIIKRYYYKQIGGRKIE